MDSGYLNAATTPYGLLAGIDTNVEPPRRTTYCGFVVLVNARIQRVFTQSEAKALGTVAKPIL